MAVEKIDGALFRKALIHSSRILKRNKKVVDSLNVYPVPDGDTGTNMSLTVEQAVEEARKVKGDNLKRIVDAAAWGSLMGARGNSGVILSQLFRGFAAGVPAGKDWINAQELAVAFKKGVDEAYRAVLRPVEGTILTVAREAADKLLAEAKRSKDIVENLEKMLDHARKVLDKTPEMLSILKEAGVVDAGGKGLIFLLEGFLQALKNPALIEEDETGESADPVEQGTVRADIRELEYIYCTELIVEGREIDIDALKSQVMPLGDSLLITGMNNVVKLHIHTNHPGEVLERALKWGELSKIKVDNMKLQHEEFVRSSPQQEDDKVKDTTIVAVVSGEGLKEIFKSMGTDAIIEGGQTMNPSTENILSVVNEQKSPNIIILPNNKNIILTAEQVKKLSDKNVYVVPTRSIPQGISALLAHNPLLSVEENVNNMSEALKNVITGEVTFAARDSRWNGTDIKEGDILGIVDGELIAIGTDRSEVLRELIYKMASKRDSGVLTIYCGEAVSLEEAEEVGNEVSEKYPDIEVEVYKGDQSLYYYIVSLE
ncbi:DAK2 domain-containing protein [Thermosediminibacter oceani]|uniref:DAK2 domain fusion protein YloV n=1 Tax=Thermosediminibacter oceani (strain ATCC BAA-1034 / DSM 16646 / JW/IW-1228P) TaxID=555079 RepID=D9S322_THEOJ|nr:DAK2 domain-containing protein [Thermosediminibacter oceani]ADL07799.1 DAK2 domain fusion protein YloV [Thermosediminibacter oceani DSM 16646]